MMTKQLVLDWLRMARDDCKKRAQTVQHNIDACKTEWWPLQLSILRDAHLEAANVYDRAITDNTILPGAAASVETTHALASDEAPGT